LLRLLRLLDVHASSVYVTCTAARKNLRSKRFPILSCGSKRFSIHNYSTALIGGAILYVVCQCAPICISVRIDTGYAACSLQLAAG